MDGGEHQALLTSGKEQVQEDLKGRIGDESKKIWKIAFPGILARVSTFGTIVVTQSFIGHISATDLAAFALVRTLSVRFANGIMFVYIFGGWCPQTWKGFTTAAFKDLWPVVKLSIYSGFMICLELWYTSVLVLLAGYMKNATVSISAFSICLNIHGWELMLSLGFLGSACVRVANELGRGDARAVKFSIKMNAVISMMIGVVCFVLVLVFGDKIGYMFTNEKDVADTVSSLSIILAFAILLNGLYPVLSGVAVGAGLQGTVALISLLSYYVIGIPLGVVLGYVAHWQVKGIWIGMIIGMLVQTFALSYMIWKTNWDKEVEKASDRLRQWYLKSPEDFQEKSDQS